MMDQWISENSRWLGWVILFLGYAIIWLGSFFLYQLIFGKGKDFYQKVTIFSLILSVVVIFVYAYVVTWIYKGNY